MTGWLSGILLLLTAFAFLFGTLMIGHRAPQEDEER